MTDERAVQHARVGVEDVNTSAGKPDDDPIGIQGERSGQRRLRGDAITVRFVRVRELSQNGR